jgi:hypothetical protein
MNGVKGTGQGWREVAVSAGAHLERMVNMYRELGFEVRLEEVLREEQRCLQCYDESGEIPYTLYVRSEDEVGK